MVDLENSEIDGSAQALCCCWMLLKFDLLCNTFYFVW